MKGYEFNWPRLICGFLGLALCELGVWLFTLLLDLWQHIDLFWGLNIFAASGISIVGGIALFVRASVDSEW